MEIEDGVTTNVAGSSELSHLIYGVRLFLKHAISAARKRASRIGGLLSKDKTVDHSELHKAMLELAGGGAVLPIHVERAGRIAARVLEPGFMEAAVSESVAMMAVDPVERLRETLVYSL